MPFQWIISYFSDKRTIDQFKRSEVEFMVPVWQIQGKVMGYTLEESDIG